MFFLAKKLKKKVVLFGVNTTALDAILLKILDYQEKNNLPDSEKLNFIKIVSASSRA